MVQFANAFRLQARVAALVVVAALVCSACATDRPTVQEWQPAWDRMTAAVPAEPGVDGDDLDDLCNGALVLLRANRADLVPTPDHAIDDTVTSWVELAEEAFFECPPHNSPTGGFSEAYQELLRLQGEIELVLDMDRNP